LLTDRYNNVIKLKEFYDIVLKKQGEQIVTNKIKKITILVIIICLILGVSQTALASGAFRTTAGVHLRSSASTTANSLTVVAANTSVDVLEHDPAGWSKVTVGSQTGFIRSDFLKIPTSNLPATFRTTAGVHLRSTPSTTATSITVVAANTSVEVLEHDPAGWSKVTVGGSAGHIRSDFLRYATAGTSSGSGSSGGDTSSGTGEVIATLKTIGSVNLRSGASQSTSIIRTLPIGTSVDVLSTQGDWSRVNHNGTNGFIKSDLLTSGEPGASKILLTIGSVNLRSGASQSTSIIRTLPKGTAVEVFSTQGEWSRVNHKGTNGFIKSDLLTESITQVSQTMWTVGSVNLRSGASQSTSIIRTLPRGTAVEVSSTQGEWWSVSHNNTNGFIKSTLLTTAGSNEQAIATVKTTGEINLREGPSTSTRAIKLLPKNTTVEILENESNGWSRVRTSFGNGYMKSELLGINAAVELIEWSEVKNILPLNTSLRVVDVKTGISFNLRVFSKSVHADVEPPTRDDTDAILRTRGGVWSFAARPVWVTVGNRTFAASMNGQPHDVSTIRDNGINGHFCLWFKGSASNTSNSAAYYRDMSGAVQEAYDKRP